MNDLIWKEKKNYKQRKKIFLCLLFCFCLNFNTIFFKLVFKDLSFSKIKNSVFFVVVVIKNITFIFHQSFLSKTLYSLEMKMVKLSKNTYIY